MGVHLFYVRLKFSAVNRLLNLGVEHCYLSKMVFKQVLLIVLGLGLVSCSSESTYEDLVVPVGTARLNGSLIGEDLDPNSPDYQCMLDRIEDSFRYSHHCSGTFIAKNIFVTAAHCLKVVDLYSIPSRVEPYRVRCFGSQTLAVKSMHIHPYFYSLGRSFSYIPEYEDLKFDPILSSFYHEFYNDIAIVITENASIDKFPILPNENDQVPYKKRTCSFLGFSGDHCDRTSGMGCYRDKLSLELSDKEPLDHLCNEKSGKKCLFAKEFNEFASQNIPLRLSLVGSVEEKEVYSFGDSGGGIICSTKDQQILAGVVSTIGELGIVNIKNKIGFIKQFLSLPPDERSSVQIGPELSPKYRKVLDQAPVLLPFFKTLYKSLVGLNEKVKPFAMPNSDYLDFMEDLAAWIEKDREAVYGFFYSQKIASIRYASDSQFSGEHEVFSNFEVRPFLDEPNVNFLLISINADFQEFKESFE